jgi:hypothetical protein
MKTGETIGSKLHRQDETISAAKEMPEGSTPCSGCEAMTESVRKGRAHYVCAVCGKDKSLSDFLLWEATHGKD